MRLPHSTPELTADSLPESAAWPRGYTVDRAGALHLRGVAVDDLAALWGSPLWVVDETEFVRHTKELIRVSGATPVFGSGPLSLLGGRWAKSHGWNVWGTPAALAHSWYLGIKPSRRVTDLRGALGPDSLPEHTSAIVDLGSLALLSDRRGATGRAYLDVGGLSETGLETALRRLSTHSSPLPELGGLLVELGRDETADEVCSRATRLFDMVSPVVSSQRNLFVDGRNHPEPLPIVVALAQMWNTPNDHAAGSNARVLADVTPWLLRRSSVALAQVESVHRAPEGAGAHVGLSGGLPRPWHPLKSVPLVARPLHGTSIVRVHSLDQRLGVLEAPLDVAPGEVLALAGFESAPGLCVVLAPDGTSVAVPRADEGDGPFN
jgi:hypothetical protein